ncbi:Abi family protein [Paenibacillus sp. DYY-L-2]|uniref:Abi family protein n=1 Tax=Paenibacillus sp. DYY-L-2 TaxID=3447013 RepID=UPI003F50764B
MKRASKEDLLNFKQSLSSLQASETKDEVATAVEELPIVGKELVMSFVEKAKSKEKLSVEEQIEYLKFKGITFISYNESLAKEILTDRTYYYKVTAFRKNFNKDKDNKYENIDFSILNDLATIDMHFRYLFLKLSLDIEHNIKSLIIRLITESDEDGYKIIDEYKKFELEGYRQKLIKKELSLEEIDNKMKRYETIDKKLFEAYKSKRDYSYDLIVKRKNKPSIWVLIELMSYGQLCFFITFYIQNKKYKYKELKLANSLLFDSKNIRDSSAHSRPIIFNIVGPNQFLISDDKHIKLQVRNYLTQTCNISNSITNIRLRNLKVHDISALLYLHDYYVKGRTTRIERKKELLSLIKRCRLKKSYYEEHQEFEEIIYILFKLIRNYKVKT